MTMIFPHSTRYGQSWFAAMESRLPGRTSQSTSLWVGLDLPRLEHLIQFTIHVEDGYIVAFEPGWSTSTDWAICGSRQAIETVLSGRDGPNNPDMSVSMQPVIDNRSGRLPLPPLDLVGVQALDDPGSLSDTPFSWTCLLLDTPFGNLGYEWSWDGCRIGSINRTSRPGVGLTAVLEMNHFLEWRLGSRSQLDMYEGHGCISDPQHQVETLFHLLSRLEYAGAIHIHPGAAELLGLVAAFRRQSCLQFSALVESVDEAISGRTA